MSTERLVRQALEDSVKTLPCPEPDIEQLLAAGRASRRRRVVLVTSLAAAAVLVLVLAGLSFAWAGRSGRALEPVPANPTTTATTTAPTTTPTPTTTSIATSAAASVTTQQQWIDALPAGAPPATPYWHDGTLFVNGERIPAPYGAVDIRAAGQTVLVAGYQRDDKDGAPQWALVRGGRLEPLRVPPGTREVGLSVDGRIASWMDRQEAGTTRFSTWDTETNTALAARTVPGRTAELWGVDAAGNGYLQTDLSDPHLTRWDVRADTMGPTDLTYAAEAPETFFEKFPPWMHTEDSYRSPDGTRRLAREHGVPWSSSCCDRLWVRPVGPDESVVEDLTLLSRSKDFPKTRSALGEGDGYWAWWESNESVLLTVDGDSNTYLVRCSTPNGDCQRVADLGPDTTQTDYYNAEWVGEWGFARAPASQ